MIQPGCISVTEAAAALGCSESTIRRMIHRRAFFQAFKSGGEWNIPMAEVRALLPPLPDNARGWAE